MLQMPLTGCRYASHAEWYWIPVTWQPAIQLLLLPELTTMFDLLMLGKLVYFPMYLHVVAIISLPLDASSLRISAHT